MHAPRVLILVSFITVGLLSGCASTEDPEDVTFFSRGWINPRELDTDDDMRPIDRTGKLPPRTGIREPL